MIKVGNCIDLMSEMSDCSIDAIVTDPPYELGFMGKSWDATGIAYNVMVWQECLRVLKPGGHLLAFGGSRTYHRLACAIEDAGFQIRDQIMWVYGSGFPKSLNISKSIEGLLTTGSANKTAFKNLAGEKVERGNWGIAQQQFKHGQRDTNYDETAGATRLGKLEPTTAEAKQWDGWGTALKPAHEPIVVAWKPSEISLANKSNQPLSRFLYYPKASTSERNAGLSNMPKKKADLRSDTAAGAWKDKSAPHQNYHPTVKPVNLMRNLIKSVTPLSGTVLDPFIGSGTTAVAAIQENINWLGFEMNPEYATIAKRRAEHASF